MNAGLSLCIGGMAEDITDGIKLAAELIDGGAAYKKLEAFVEASNS